LFGSVSTHYNLQSPIARICEDTGLDEKGANLSGMLEAAEKLVSEAKGVRSDMTSLSKIPKHATTLLIDL